MSMAKDFEREQEIKDRLADRFTTTELCDILEIPVEEFIEIFWEFVLSKPLLLEEVGLLVEDSKEEE